ncbi:hypothetical protein BaRGS_00018603 [Batillaria attramentaria]|uniref:Uncharacterized protein n=1 Tax=Batillaria attramentaria TaxID=370345 RepID=A0ABD0KSP5_9CAEN
MASQSSRSTAGRGYINMLADRYKQPDPMFDPGPGKKTYRTEEVSYSYSQEEEARQDGRTLYKTREEQSFTGGFDVATTKKSSELLSMQTASEPLAKGKSDTREHFADTDQPLFDTPCEDVKGRRSESFTDDAVLRIVEDLRKPTLARHRLGNGAGITRRRSASKALGSMPLAKACVLLSCESAQLSGPGFTGTDHMLPLHPGTLSPYTLLTILNTLPLLTPAVPHIQVKLTGLSQNTLAGIILPQYRPCGMCVERCMHARGNLFFEFSDVLGLGVNCSPLMFHVPTVAVSCVRSPVCQRFLYRVEGFAEWSVPSTEIRM